MILRAGDIRRSGERAYRSKLVTAACLESAQRAGCSTCVNAALSKAETDALLDVLDRGLVLIRLAAMSRDAERAEAIADALHNVPGLLKQGDKWGWTITAFREMFLMPLVQRYPDLSGLERRLGEID